jgi:hypothetical protein
VFDLCNHQPVTACAPDKQKQIGLNVSVSTSTTVPNQRERIHTIDDLPNLKIGHGIKILAQDLVLDPVFPLRGIGLVSSRITLSVEQSARDVGQAALPRARNGLLPHG